MTKSAVSDLKFTRLNLQIYTTGYAETPSMYPAGHRYYCLHRIAFTMQIRTSIQQKLHELAVERGKVGLIQSLPCSSV